MQAKRPRRETALGMDDRMPPERPVPSHSNADQIRYWNATAGETWASLQQRLDQQIEPLGRAAMGVLAPAPGERVIDIGCGCGQTTADLASRVGASGDVLGIDVSGPMLAVARRRQHGRGAAGTRFLEADAQTHAFERGEADAVFSRFGVMFFDDPIAAFRNIRAALRPAGRMAFVCWRAMEHNPFMTVPMAAAAQYLPTPPARLDPAAPGPFAFADREKLAGILSQAGFSAIEVAPHDESIGGGDIDQSLETALSIGPLGAVLRETPELRPVVEKAVRSALEPYDKGGVVRLPSASWIVSATNAARDGSGGTGSR